MTTFDSREKAFEDRFQYDEELKFKVTARRNHLLGLWAAEKMNLTGESAEAYAATIVQEQFDGGDDHIVEKITFDILEADVAPICTPANVLFELKNIEKRSLREIMQE